MRSAALAIAFATSLSLMPTSASASARAPSTRAMYLIAASAERLRWDGGDADRGPRRERGDRPREVCRAAGPADDDAHAARLKRIDPLAERLGRAVRRETPRLGVDAEPLEHVGGQTHRRL